MTNRVRVAVLVVAASLCSCGDARGAVNFSIKFDDPGGVFNSIAGPLEDNVQAAANRWSQFLQGDANLEVVVRPNDNLLRATGYSLTTAFVRNNGTFNVFEQAAGAEIRTGTDPNGTNPNDFDTYDIAIEFDTDYLFNNMWMDPNPFTRTATIPDNRTDAMSVLLHEFGHAIGFNGWINGTTGEYPGNYQSTLDELTMKNGNYFYFTGSQASALYGGPVPITLGNPFHFGNNSPGPGSSLIPDMMNGIAYYYGTRYDISALDLAVLRDINIPATAPPDYDRDGDVDSADNAVWRRSFGSQSALAADGNDDGVIDTADYVVWRKSVGISIPNTGTGAGGTSFAVASVPIVATPEPDCILLYVLGGMLLMGWRRCMPC